ncbi:DUF2066 domain-containing protein [Catenovulum sediminis]|uniref:DUF2066 domain-containing protein n=1 Tax=Catenovulum sediminis TaxID=1740262 RepID=UPI00117C250E|nr:DUF2066 domain-containing protein [Catenovulum sediminis]
MMINKFCIFILVILASAPVFSVEVEGLYLGVVEVKGQSYQDRKVAYKSAIKQVLVRVSGNQGVVELPELARVINEPTEYLSQYRFLQQNGQLYLEARFNEKLINGLLKDKGLTIWGTRRPQTLWWLAIEEENKRYIISEEKQQYTQIIAHHAKLRGVPYIFPLMDFDDRMQISITDVWGRFANTVKSASERYNAEAIVMARIFTQTNEESVLAEGWMAQVSVLEDKKLSTHTFIRDDLELVWPEMVNWVADQLAHRYSIKAQGYTASSLNITIENIENAAQAVAIQGFLTTISAVDNVLILQINESGVTFQLNLLGEALDVLDALSLDSRVEKVKPIFGQENKMVENLYQWKGKFH